MFKRSLPSVLAASLLALAAAASFAQQPAPVPTGALSAQLLQSITLRNIGPALTPGRVSDIAVDPKNDSTWYISIASGGVWKTTNRGITFSPIFDNYGSYSTGCIVIDPNNSNILWLGTGENQASRSMSFGDGLYKSTDAGETWTRAGLPNSEHIAKIFVDPRNSDTVLVAAQGPLWAPGGDRGIYKTTDGGKTWKPVLQVSENTGATELVPDPRNPDVLYAATWQRRRNVGVMVGSGPEAAIYKSTNNGDTWTKLTNGLPSGDVGRIALAVSPQRPEVVYALIIAGQGQTGCYKSENAGESWTRQSNQGMVDPQYYGEIYCDPHEFDLLYSMDMNPQVSRDGGKTWQATFAGIHVDHHALWLDPKDPNHLLSGNDGGLYESYDDARTWRHFTNMPTLQYYHIGLDNALPFYNVAAGAQDNGSQLGPSRTVNRIGIRNPDWISIGGGDGMQPRIDPEDPSIIYSMSQNGAIQRLDKRTSVSRGIRPATPGGRGRGAAPEEGEGEEGGGDNRGASPRGGRGAPAGRGEPGADGQSAASGGIRWNWNAPFLISHHNPARLYLAGSRIFRSDSRGDSWNPFSPDLTRQLDREQIPVMGKIWPPETVARNTFTTDLSIITSLSESPHNENILVAGTDDGLIQVTDDGGRNWRKIDAFPDLPDQSYCSNIHFSSNDPNTFYATFNNWQRGDFKPYLLKTTNLGRSFTSIRGDLPDRNPLWCVAEDHLARNLLFAGAEYGLYVSVDGGQHWVQLKGNVPTIAFRDVQIHKRESDLVAGTFGRGIFVLDDISAFRGMTNAALAQEAALFPMRRALQYADATYTRATPGDFVAPNPPVGALVTYYLKSSLALPGAPARGAAAGDGPRAGGQRGGRGGRGGAAGGGPTGPTGVALMISNEGGSNVRRIDVPATAGLHRVSWDLRGGLIPASPTPSAPGQQPITETQPGQPVQTANTQTGQAGEIVTQAGQATQPAEAPARGTGRAGRGGRGGGGGGGGGGAQALVPPGRYTVTLGRWVNNSFTSLAPPQTVEVVPLPAPSR